MLSAAKSGDADEVRRLLKAGTPPDDGGKEGEITPLWWAASNGHEVCVKLLVDAKANVEAADDIGRTPAFKAAQDGRDICLKLLIDAGADTSIVNKSLGMTPEAGTRRGFDRGGGMGGGWFI